MSRARVMVIGLDAMDPALTRAFARAGELPAMARLMREAAVVETRAPVGVFVSANWPTIFTATRPDRHNYLCWEEFRGGTYDYRETDPSMVHGTPVWERLSEAGRRVAVLDVPHSVARPVNGAVVSEWGCHDRHFGTLSWPPELAGELADRHGTHLGSCEPPGRDQFAPCDYIRREGAERTGEETVALFDDICRGLEIKRAASLDLLDRGGWDLFWSVMGESHCVGHQMWHLHEREHPRHDAALAARLGGDPLLEVYRRLDSVVGDHLARLGPDDTAYVLLAHGMAAHHDGTHLLDQVLHRLDWGLDEPGGFGTGTRAAAEVARLIPAPVRGRTLRLAAPLLRRHGGAVAPDTLPPPSERRWFLTPNNTVVGAVRLNLAGREPAGRVHPDDRRQVLRWLARRLEEIVNVDTGGRVVRRCVVTDDVYRRSPGDALADLFVEWERSAPIERVWSPAIGTVAVPYEHWRQGDHVREGMTLATGPGIEPGRRRGVFDVVDLGATFAAAAGVELREVDGRPIASVLPAAARAADRAPVRRRARGLERALRRGAERRVPGWARRAAPAADRLRADLTPPVDHAHARLDAAQAEAQELRQRLGQLERHSDIGTMTSWLRHADVPEDLLISVILPTRNRRALVAEAIASVEAQTYTRWELVIVDDGSEDGTDVLLSGLTDPRVRTVRTEGVGECGARNAGLDAARGDVVTYLDDDNRFDPQWLKAVAATFNALPGASVAYGARVCDDHGRLQKKESSGRPWLLYLPWDEDAARDVNLADTNVLAHRRSDVRYDESLTYFVDWDLLLRLSRDAVPVEIPAIAVYYKTDAEGRVSMTVSPEEMDRQYRIVRGRFERDARTEPAAP